MYSVEGVAMTDSEEPVWLKGVRPRDRTLVRDKSAGLPKY